MFARRTTRWATGLGVALVWALATGPSSFAWTWPADGPVLRGFSVGADAYAAGQHRGIDVALEGSAPIRAPVAGEVTFAGAVPTNGLTVTIAVRDAKVSLTHLGTLHVRRGDVVSEDDVLAEPGPTGEAEHGAPYVHLGVRVGPAESYVDPLTLLPPRRASLPPSAPEAPPAPHPAPEPSPPPSAVPESPAAVTPPAAPAPGSVDEAGAGPTADAPPGSTTSATDETGGGVEIGSLRVRGTARPMMRSNRLAAIASPAGATARAHERGRAPFVVVRRPSPRRAVPSSVRGPRAAVSREPRTPASAVPVRPGDDHRGTRALEPRGDGSAERRPPLGRPRRGRRRTGRSSGRVHPRSPAGRAKGTPYHWRP